MTKKELMDGIKKHKVKIICAAAGAAGLTLVALRLSNKKPNCNWTNVTLDNTDKIQGCMKWNGKDEYNGSVLLGLKDVNLSEVTTLTADALTKSGIDEDQVLKEVIVLTNNS